jgi:hypothetical protein
MTYRHYIFSMTNCIVHHEYNGPNFNDISDRNILQLLSAVDIADCIKHVGMGHVVL